ncbi:hypothetical protein ACFRI7_22240 [Streptomyces sp. NPDC056716]|uniref:hypothetical protein n=1 Tax=unclassified Streptomyces TaxID=2593676 RepID=UPI00368957CC
MRSSARRARPAGMVRITQGVPGCFHRLGGVRRIRLGSGPGAAGFLQLVLQAADLVGRLLSLALGRGLGILCRGKFSLASLEKGVGLPHSSPGLFGFAAAPHRGRGVVGG